MVTEIAFAGGRLKGEVGNDDPYATARELISKGASGSRALSPRDLFRLVCSLQGEDDADSNLICISEFKEIFRLLSFEVSNDQLQVLFALCDVDNSGYISEQEFVAQWERALQQYLSSKQTSVGLSRAQIVLAVSSVTLAMGFLVGFVLMAFGAWGERDIFRVLVSSSFIAGSGTGITKNRNKSAAEGEECDATVEKIIIDDEEAAHDEEPFG